MGYLKLFAFCIALSHAQAETLTFKTLKLSNLNAVADMPQKYELGSPSAEELYSLIRDEVVSGVQVMMNDEIKAYFIYGKPGPTLELKELHIGTEAPPETLKQIWQFLTEQCEGGWKLKSIEFEFPNSRENVPFVNELKELGARWNYAEDDTIRISSSIEPSDVVSRKTIHLEIPEHTFSVSRPGPRNDNYSNPQEGNPYQVLGVPQNATLTHIHEHFKERTSDQNLSDGEMRRLSAAYWIVRHLNSGVAVLQNKVAGGWRYGDFTLSWQSAGLRNIQQSDLHRRFDSSHSLSKFFYDGFLKTPRKKLGAACVAGFCTLVGSALLGVPLNTVETLATYPLAFVSLGYLGAGITDTRDAVLRHPHRRADKTKPCDFDKFAD